MPDQRKPTDPANQLDRIEFGIARLEEFLLNGVWLTWDGWVEDHE